MRQLILLLILPIICYSQSRKSILKEIKSFEKEIYFNTLYHTSDDTLKWVIYDYFKEKDYKLSKNIDSNYFYIYTKKIQHPQIKNSIIESIVYVDILPRGLLKKVNVNVEEKNYEKPFTRTPNSKYNTPINTHYFSKRNFYSYLYKYFNNNKINYPTTLLDKIAVYNQQQKKDKKKILEGRDY